MALMYDKVVEQCGNVIIPIMITCDPARDTPEVLKEYLKEFHPEILGLTGDYEAIKQTCKEYRVYFSTPPNVKPGQDYLVDHSIYFYLMGKWLLRRRGVVAAAVSTWRTDCVYRSGGRLRRGHRPQLHG